MSKARVGITKDCFGKDGKLIDTSGLKYFEMPSVEYEIFSETTGLQAEVPLTLLNK